MKKLPISFLLLFLFFADMLLAQRKQVLEHYAQKFYKLNNEVYGLIHPKKNQEAHLLKSILKNNDIKQIFPYSHFGLISTSYPNLIFDINAKSFIVLEKNKMLSGDERVLTSFFSQKEPDSKEWGEKPVNENVISRNLTGIGDFYMKIIMGKDNPKGYWHYDMILQKDETLLMPVGYGDSIYFYAFTDKAWTKPDYQGVEKNKENDKWARTSQVKHDFKTGFRAFQIAGDTYFLANADTMLYKYQNNALKEIGRIKPKDGERTLFLIDKDDDKVYFLFAQSIDIVAEERKRFGLLTQKDPLLKAVKRIIDEPDRK